MNGFDAGQYGSSGQQMSMDDLMKRLLQYLRDTSYRGFDEFIRQLLSTNPVGPPGGGGGGNGGGSGGGGGGGGNCLTGDVPIRMADGSEKPARDIKVNDLIMGFDPGIGHVPQSVFTVTSASQECVLVEFEGGSIEASTTHNWFVIDDGKRKIVSTFALKVGMKLVGEDDLEHEVTALTPTKTQVVYWWNCLPNQCYFAGGVLHHNASDPNGYLQPAWADKPYPYGGPTLGKEISTGVETGGGS